MTLDEAIRLAADFAGLVPPALPTSLVAQESARLADRYEGTRDAPAAATIDEVIASFRAVLADPPPAWAKVPARHWRMLPWCLWAGDSPLAREPLLLDALEHRLRLMARRSEVRLLISAYLRDYAPERPALKRIGRLLAELATRWDWDWRARQRKLRLFDPTEAPRRLAAACLDHPGGPSAGLAAAGLERFPDDGLAFHALLAALAKLEPTLAEGRDAGVLLPGVLAWSTAREGGIHPKLRGPLAEALLRPWTTRAPADAAKKKIQDFLLRHYGDPRIRPHSWLPVAEDAKAVFRKWLVKVALDQYLDVIDQTVIEYRHQWRYRRAFWTAYFRRDWISDAHVMFGEVGLRKAKALFGRDAPCASLTADGKQVSPDHAVLLLRIGRLTIADWSHNGRCAIWVDGGRHAPPFDRNHYTSADVDADVASWETRHAGAEFYSWQRKVRDFIHGKTGLRLADHELEVR
jgi:hypothetical protein